jgi:hypothetical protein
MNIYIIFPLNQAPGAKFERGKHRQVGQVAQSV